MTYTVKIHGQIELETQVEAEDANAAFDLAKFELRANGQISQIDGSVRIAQEICK